MDFTVGYMIFYELLRKNDRAIIINYDVNVLTDKYGEQFFCLPHFIVNYKFNGVLYSNYKTYDIDLHSFDDLPDTMVFDHWNDTTKRVCINRFIDMNNDTLVYIYQSKMKCYEKNPKGTSECLCTLEKNEEGYIDESVFIICMIIFMTMCGKLCICVSKMNR